MVTPLDSVKPGSVVAQALLAQLAYALLSTKDASSAVGALRTSASARALKPRVRYAANWGIAMAARMPMIATTTRSSIKVKPFDFFRFILLVFAMAFSLSSSLLGHRQVRL